MKKSKTVGFQRKAVILSPDVITDRNNIFTVFFYEFQNTVFLFCRIKRDILRKIDDILVVIRL